MPTKFTPSRSTMDDTPMDALDVAGTCKYPSSQEEAQRCMAPAPYILMVHVECIGPGLHSCAKNAMQSASVIVEGPEQMFQGADITKAGRRECPVD